MLRTLANLIRPLCVAAVVACLACATVALRADIAAAAFGDNYGMAPVNGGGGQSAPALPGDHAFWAGACDIGDAPDIGDDMTDDGGIGARPSQVLAPDTFGHPSFAGFFNQTPVTAPPTPAHCIAWGAPGTYGNPVTSLWTQPPAWRLPSEIRAGAHPDGSATFAFNRGSGGRVDGAVDNLYVDLPPGFVGNPNAVPKCPAAQFNNRVAETGAYGGTLCPPETQVGILHLEIEGGTFNLASNLNLGGDGTALSEDVYPVYNIEPRRGNVAELGFGYASSERATTVRLVAKARTNSDFGVTTFVGQIPAALPVIAQQITLWGVPWAAHNDRWRAPEGYSPRDGSQDACAVQPGASPSNAYYIPPTGFATLECQAHYAPSWGPIKPFLSNETDCNPAPIVRLATDAYQNPGPFTAEGDPDLPPFPGLATGSNWKTYQAPSPAVEGCASLGFQPDIDFSPSSSAADSATGLSVGLSVPQNNEPPFAVPQPGADQGEVDAYVSAASAHWRSDAGRAAAHLRDTVVTLPPGVSVNPSSASGLAGCSDADIGLRQLGSPPLFNNEDPFDGQGAECPDGSKIGTVEVDTPLLEEPLTGDVVLGQPKAEDIGGPDESLTFRTFLVLRNPERGLVAKIFGSATADPVTGQLTATFTRNPEIPFDDLRLDLKGGSRGMLAMPQRCGSVGWSTSITPWSGGPAVADTGAFNTDSNCGFGFAPTLLAGMDKRQGGGTGTFTFEFAREDGEQWLKGLTAVLPTGLLASVKDVPLCTNAQADSNTCPAASRIGQVDAGAGSGSPFFLEKKGTLYLTEGYKGAPYGLAVSVPVEAGPFKGEFALNAIVVRQALHVDRTTAQVTAVSDPFPEVWHGIPLRVRRVQVKVDRPAFMQNPSDCSAKEIKATILSAQGTAATTKQPFQATGCSTLGFKPQLALQLTGRKQVRTGKHPGVKATVTQKTGEAGIEKAVVRLPKSLALDVDNAQALCEYVDGIKPDIENHCPKGSIVGRARAVSPLLKQPLAGNVYFVKNVRIDPKTGNQIRTLPMIIVALRGEIAINLKGVSSTTNAGRLVNTFGSVPDAPVDQFNLNINGGRNGILAVTRTRKGLINLCAAPKSHIAQADIDGHNGRRYDRNPRLETPCATKKTSAKRGAKAKRAKQRAG